MEWPLGRRVKRSYFPERVRKKPSAAFATTPLATFHSLAAARTRPHSSLPGYGVFQQITSPHFSKVFCYGAGSANTALRLVGLLDLL